MKISILVFLLLSIGLMSNTKPSQNNASIKYDGIDISHHQGKIDWSMVAKNTSIQYVYIKATEGKTYTDPLYRKNHNGAKKHNMRVGAMHYLRGTSGAKEQFEHFKSIVPKGSIDLIPMLDVENLDKWTKVQAQDSILVWINLCKAYYGKAPIIYDTQRSYNTYCAPKFNKYHLYIGRYGKTPPQITGKGTYSIWQFSETGKIAGIVKPVDLSRFNKGKSIKDLKLYKVQIEMQILGSVFMAGYCS